MISLTPKKYLEGLRIYYRLSRNLKKPLDELRAKQWEDFVDIVKFAYKRVPFYRHLYDQAGFSPKDLKSPSDILSVPTTRKSMFQQTDLKQLIDKHYQLAMLERRNTSGSSGEPLYVYYTPEDKIYRSILHLRILFHNGMGLRDRMAHNYFLRIPDSRYSFQKLGFLSKEFIYRADPIEQQLDQLTRINPDVLYGNASSMVLLADEVERRGQSPIRPRLIFTTGELLTPADRMLIDRAFSVRMRDIYGMEEMGDVAWQCYELQVYHLNMDSCLAEVEVDGRPANPGETGRLIITNLHSKAMPFIRYEMDDVLSAPRDVPCPCGCTFPLIDVFQGRADDWLFSRDGKRISPLVFSTISIPGVRQYRMIQKAYDYLQVEILPGPKFSDETLENVKSHVSDIMGPGLEVDVVRVDHIPQQSGKMRRIISDIEHPSP